MLPQRGAYSAPPGPLAGFNGPTSMRREGREVEEGREEGRGTEERGGKVRGPRGGNVEFHQLLFE